jgi:hypothetical protein
MKLSIALCASAATAATIPAHQEGLPLESFGQVKSVTPEEAAAGLDMGFTLHNRADQGWPLSVFGEVHHVTLEDARQHKDLGGNNFSTLPIFGPGHHANLQAWLNKVNGKVSHDFHDFGDSFRHKAEDIIDKIEDTIEDTLGPRDTGDCANPAIRFEWDDYSTSDKQAFVAAIQCLIRKPASGKFSPSRNRYEDFVRLHQSYAPNIHSRSNQQQTHKFLIWHRYYVWAFEQVLRDECGFNRAMPVSLLFFIIIFGLNVSLSQMSGLRLGTRNFHIALICHENVLEKVC